MKTIALKSIFIGVSFIFSVTLISAQQTYTQNGTTYYSGESYTTTGHQKVKRSETAKKQFLKNKGYNKVPKGYQVDHIKPLSQGGTDTPDNMQLITISEHKRKTAGERKAKSGYTTTSTKNYRSSYYKSTTSKNNYRNNYNSSSTSSRKAKTKYNYSTPSYKNSGRTIKTGSRGGQYYINSKGNKTYVKKR